MTEKKTQIKDTREKINMERKREETKRTEMTQFLINDKKFTIYDKKTINYGTPSIGTQ